MKIIVMVWKQKNRNAKGSFVRHEIDSVMPEMSFLEMVDVLNERIEAQGEEPVSFESDCREGICGTCGMMINGEAHGPDKAIATCQLHMRRFKDGDTIYLEPFRARAFPIIKDLVVDRSALDRINQAGGYVSSDTGSAPEANANLIAKDTLERSMDAAQCIACGACIAACPNASASLFTGAKVSHLSLLPQGEPERERRVQQMVEQAEAEGFGSCTNIGECQEVCPKEISIGFIGRMNSEYHRTHFFTLKDKRGKVKAQ